jgi:hypothetical protein
MIAQMIDEMPVRELQKEAARVLASEQGFGNHDLVRFNKLAHHDSHAWYRAVISWYVEQHGDLPSRVGPGMNVKLLMEDAPETRS